MSIQSINRTRISDAGEWNLAAGYLFGAGTNTTNSADADDASRALYSASFPTERQDDLPYISNETLKKLARKNPAPESWWSDTQDSAHLP